jgi:hypothetical protein
MLFREIIIIYSKNYRKQKLEKSPGTRSNTLPETESEWKISYRPCVPRWNDGIIFFSEKYTKPVNTFYDKMHNYWPNAKLGGYKQAYRVYHLKRNSTTITYSVQELNQKPVHPRVTDSSNLPQTLDSRSPLLLGHRSRRAEAVQMQTWIHKKNIRSFSNINSHRNHFCCSRNI